MALLWGRITTCARELLQAPHAPRAAVGLLLVDLPIRELFSTSSSHPRLQPGQRGAQAEVHAIAELRCRLTSRWMSKLSRS